jgi:TDG/mug DNA glycosylase family protein
VTAPRRPTRQEVAAAHGRTVPDVIAEGLDVLFVGINPGLYSGAVGHHFARPGNRFWRALAGSGLVDRVLSPFEDGDLPAFGLGITNLVGRATARADELRDPELRAGARRLVAKVHRFAPRTVAVVGLTAYRTAFCRPRASVGERSEGIGGSRAWVLPNPSGLNATYQMPDLIGAFADLRVAVRGIDDRRDANR